MQICIITFTSQTAAYKFRKMAQNSKIAVKIIQTPKEISYGGCSYGARVNRRDVSVISALCAENNISYSRIFAEYTDTNGRKSYEQIG